MKFLFGFILTVTIAIFLQIDNVQASNEADAACGTLAEDVVCGFNGKCFKTFKNPCYLAFEACHGKKKFTQVANCACDVTAIGASKRLCVCRNSYVSPA